MQYMATKATDRDHRTRDRMTARQRRRLMQDIILVSPQLCLFVVLVIVPLVIAVPMLFTDRKSFIDVDVEYVGLDNFTRVFWDEAIAEEYWPALKRTALFTLFNYVMVYVFGLTLALLMYEIGFKSGLFTMIYMPQMLSGLALGFVALMLFSPSTGVVNLMLDRLGWMGDPVNIKTERGTTVILPIMVGWKAAGFNLAIFLSGLLTIPQETIEAAIVDGSSYVQRLWRIYFPQMVPSFTIATIFCLLGSFTIFDELVALGGLEANRAAEFLSVVITRYGFSPDSPRLALGLTLSVETFIPLTLVAFLLLRLQRRFSST
jgi:ABC-type sugar transport system permease subunit